MRLLEIFLIIVILIALVFLGMIVSFFKVWLRAAVSNARVGIFNLFFMSLRKVPPRLIVEARIQL